MWRENDKTKTITAALPAAQYRCCSGSAVSGERGAGGREGPAGGFADCGMEQRWLCDAALGSQGAGSDHPATPGGSCDGSPPGTKERTGGRRQAPLEKEEWRQRRTRRKRKKR